MATLIRTKNGRRTINTRTQEERILDLAKQLGYNLREYQKMSAIRLQMRMITAGLDVMNKN